MIGSTLVENARVLLEHQAQRPLVTFIAEDDSETTLTRGEFFAGAANYAAALENAGIQSGDLVVLVMEQGHAVMQAFWGALLMGAIPSIFPFVNEKLDREHYFNSIRQLIGFEGVRAVITLEQFTAGLRDTLAGAPVGAPTGTQEGDDVQIITAETLTASGGAHGALAAYFARPLPDPDATAFLQHSSGSTGLQKGVMLSHRAVMQHVRDYAPTIGIQTADKTDSPSLIISWLPLYHDMGLIAAFILPIVTGTPLVIMSPFVWVRQPAMLLRAITRHTATHVWLPNFAYNFMATRIRDAALTGIDLSSLDYVINCSEPVYAESHRTFAQRFTPYGLRESALQVCYAMAENTFAVTQTFGVPRIDRVDRRRFAEERIATPAEGDAPSSEIVSCGVPISGVQVRICAEAGDTLPDRHVGEIELLSATMLTGYYRRDDLQPFHDGWFKTGDMGYLADGHLYVTGRKKDLIIVAGKNVYPQDIENLLNDLPGVYPGRVVAFGVPNDALGTEDVAVLVESAAESVDDEERGDIVRAIRARVAADTEVTARYVEVLPPRQLIKTSSGKIARAANRERFLMTLG